MFSSCSAAYLVFSSFRTKPFHLEVTLGTEAQAVLLLPSAKQPAAALKRELGLRDLTLFAIGCVISVRWLPIAAHAGPGSVTLWLLAVVFFVVPLTIAVAALVAKYPGAGGL
jgi:amino acid permease